MERVDQMRRDRKRHSEKGQALVEFALTLVFIMVFILSIIELIMFIYTYNVVADSAKEGVRYAIVHGADMASAQQVGPTCPCPAIDGDPGTGVVKTAAQLSFRNVSGTAMTVNVDYNPDNANPGGKVCNKAPCLVRVRVTYPYHWFFGLGWSTVNVYANAEGRIAF